MGDDERRGSLEYFTEAERILHHRYLRLASSSIPYAGIGVFLEKDALAETWVGVANGPSTRTPSEYTIWMNREDLLMDIKGPTRFLNCSPEPNVYFRKEGDKLALYTFCELPKGIELLLDYSQPAIGLLEA